MSKLSLEFYVKQLEKATCTLQYTDIMSKISLFHLSKGSAIIQKMMQGKVFEGVKIYQDHLVDCTSSMIRWSEKRFYEKGVIDRYIKP